MTQASDLAFYTATSTKCWPCLCAHYLWEWLTRSGQALIRLDCASRILFAHADGQAIEGAHQGNRNAQV